VFYSLSTLLTDDGATSIATDAERMARRVRTWCRGIRQTNRCFGTPPDRCRWLKSFR
jgi:hypothetical protein